MNKWSQIVCNQPLILTILRVWVVVSLMRRWKIGSTDIFTFRMDLDKPDFRLGPGLQFSTFNN